ncbi:MAG: hypothetical protein V2A58_05250 [Planctomycetota bacterium]
MRKRVGNIQTLRKLVYTRANLPHVFQMPVDRGHYWGGKRGRGHAG